VKNTADSWGALPQVQVATACHRTTSNLCPWCVLVSSIALLTLGNGRPTSVSSPKTFRFSGLTFLLVKQQSQEQGRRKKLPTIVGYGHMESSSDYHLPSAAHES
jgi:hypothetical protein